MRKIICYSFCSMALLFAACKKDAVTSADKEETKNKPRARGEMVFNTVTAFGVEAQGADIAVKDINGNGIPDIFLMHHDAPTPGANQFRYQVAYDVDMYGATTNFSDVKSLWSGVSSADGAGMSIGDIDKNGIPDIVLMSYDAPSSGPNVFKYIVGFNLNASGNPAYWSNFYTIPGISSRAMDASAALGDIDGNGTLDLLLAACDATGYIRYQVAFNLAANGQAATTLPNYVTVNHVAANNQGLGVDLSDLNGDGRPEVIFMGYDNPSGLNSFRTFSATFNTNGSLSNLTPFYQYTGVCYEAQGAGVALADIDNNGKKDIIFMAEDNPPGTNYFKYYVGFDLKENRYTKVWMTDEVPK